MENLKLELSQIESCFGQHIKRDWSSTIKLVQTLMSEYREDVEINIRVIYMLHNILVEEEYSNKEYELISYLLKKYFEESFQQFSENSEYLFFIGKILYIAEWYFGISDDDNPIEERLAFKMQKKAFEKEPDNLLFKWAYIFSINNKKEALNLSEIILFDNSEWLNWLRTKGFPGTYLIESLEYCYNNYKKMFPKN